MVKNVSLCHISGHLKYKGLLKSFDSYTQLKTSIAKLKWHNTVAKQQIMTT